MQYNKPELRDIWKKLSLENNWKATNYFQDFVFLNCFH